MLDSFLTAFILGLLTPLGAVCVLPLYPGFLAYLSNKVSGSESKKQMLVLSFIVTLGVIVFMSLLGIVFSMILEVSLTKVIGIVSPLAFGILGLISLMLIFNFDFTKIFPQVTSPTSKSPKIEAFLFGFFFGAVVVPCNPLFIAALFVKSLSTTKLLTNIIQFVFFGFGIGFPLIVLAALSSVYSKSVISFLTKHKRKINLATGLIMLCISLYYLIFVFGVLDFGSDERILEEVDIIMEEREVPAKYVPLYQREVQTLGDGTKYIVHPSKIDSGGPPKDGIPSIDNPKFVSIEEAEYWIQDNELVMAIEHKGITRVYPLQILVWHEIVNDVIAGDPLLITYCPLCGTGIAYEGKIDGKRVEFGTSGKLYNSNLVMYDRQTDSYWSQIDGVGIVGELTGKRLKQVSIDTVSWREFKEAHSEAEVLSQDTGFNREYGNDPYGNYYEDSFVMFPVENQDNRIHAKTVIFGIEVDGMFKAYTEEALKREAEIQDTFNGVDLVVNRSNSGKVRIFRKDNGEEIVKERNFWFSWYAFHPDTDVYQ